MTSKLFVLLLLASASIAKSRWFLIELEDEEDHREAEKDGDEKVLRVEGGRLAKDQHHGKKKHQNHGKRNGKPGAGKDYNAQVSGGGPKPFIGRFTGQPVKSF